MGGTLFNTSERPKKEICCGRGLRVSAIVEKVWRGSEGTKERGGG